MLVPRLSLILVAACAGTAAAAAAGNAPEAAAEGVVRLQEDTFDTTTSQGLWLLEFYAPWCGHCKQLEPVLRDFGRANSRLMRIGMVDATVETGLASRYDIHGYPTLKYRKNGGAVRDYHGGRGYTELLRFAERMQGPPVRDVAAAPAIDTALATGDTLFVFIEGSPSTEDSRAAFAKVAAMWQDRLTFMRVGTQLRHEGIMPFVARAPAVVRLRAGEDPVLYGGSLGDEGTLQAWIQGQRFARVEDIGPQNFRDMRDSGKLLVVAAVQPNTPQAATARSMLHRIANPATSPLSESERSDMLFGVLDGDRWGGFLSQYNVYPNDLPRVIVLDPQNARFFEDTEVRSEEQVVAYLREIVQGTAVAQYEGFAGMLTRVHRVFLNNLPYSALMTAAALALIIFICKCVLLPSVDNGEMPAMPEKSPLHGTTPAARAEPRGRPKIE